VHPLVRITSAVLVAAAVLLPTPTDAATQHRATTAGALARALDGARPGAVIRLEPGVFADRHGFTIARDCTAELPCTLIGSERSQITTGGHAYGVHVTADHWRLVGFTVTDASKGIVLDDGDHDVIRRVTVTDIGDEGIHLRSGSSRNKVVGCRIDGTGKDQPGYGEGLYVGSAHSNWSTYGADGGHGPDRSNHNRLVRNRVSHTGAESADVKEGTRGTVLRGNRFDGRGMSGENYADSLVDLKGNHALVVDNHGVHVPSDGAWTVHHVYDGWGNHNRIRGNTPGR
jgi:hypothetical protein